MNKNGSIFKKAKIWDLQVVWWHLIGITHFDQNLIDLSYWNDQL